MLFRALSTLPSLTVRLPSYRVWSRIACCCCCWVGKKSPVVGNKEGITKRHERWEMNGYAEGLFLPPIRGPFLGSLPSLGFSCDHIVDMGYCDSFGWRCMVNFSSSIFVLIPTTISNLAILSLRKMALVVHTNSFVRGLYFLIQG